MMVYYTLFTLYSWCVLSNMRPSFGLQLEPESVIVANWIDYKIKAKEQISQQNLLLISALGSITYLSNLTTVS